MKQTLFTILSSVIFPIGLYACMEFNYIGAEGYPCGKDVGCYKGLECCPDDICRKSCLADGDTSDAIETSDVDTTDGYSPISGDTDGPVAGDQDIVDSDFLANGDEDVIPGGDVDAEIDRDVKENIDTDTTCDCITGPCCERCNYRPPSYICSSDIATEFQCSGSACGDDSQKRTQLMYCSGSSAECNGSTVWSDWVTHENCGSGEKCDSDNKTYAICSTNSSCTTSFSCFNEIDVCADPVTGLEWQRTPTGGPMQLEAAKAHCQNLTLDGRGWRLPNISELRSLIRNCADIEMGGDCRVKDECASCEVNSGDVCLEYDSCMESSVCNPSLCTDDGGVAGCYWPQELNGTCTWYWSSSTVNGDFSLAWFVSFYDGVVDGFCVDDRHVRCVRGGP